MARDIARVLNVRGRRDGYIEGPNVRITWCVGHLVELASPERYRPEWKTWRLETLPMMPSEFDLVARDGAKDQWRVVKRLLGEAREGEVINACDAGREGELIFARAYQLSQCRLPVRRLWISSMTDEAIRKGFDRLREGESMQPLEDAARCRAEADWLVGLNATRAMTVKMRQFGGSALLSVGRVQTPTLALVVERDLQIEDFKPRTYWQVKAQLSAEQGQWQATWTRLGPRGGVLPTPKTSDDPPDEAWPDRLWEREQAEEVCAKLMASEGAAVHRVQRKDKREPPPMLYDLTTLQKEANKRFGYTAKRTLEIAQRLYEQHKVLTYPRTDSRHLATDQVAQLPDVLRGVAFGPYEAFANDPLQRWPVKLGKRFVDNAEVSDHHAIIPTGVDPRRVKMSVEDKRVFDLVARRFLAMFAADAIFATATVDVRVEDSDRSVHCLLAKGRSQIEAGWRLVDPPQNKGKELLLPAVNRGDPVQIERATAKEGSTRPPQRYSEATLLSAMERAGEQLEERELARAMKRNGLGTPATRAAIIETLLARRYVSRQGKHIVSSEQGRALIQVLPTPELRSPALTGSWEARLVAMSEGKESRDDFMADVRGLTSTLVHAISGLDPNPERARVLSPPEEGGESIGTCPACNTGQVRKHRFGWRCDECTLRIPEKIAGRELSDRMVKALMKGQQTQVVKGFKARSGKEFAAALKVNVAETKVSFVFPEPEALGDCPACNKPVRRRGKIWTCETGRECSFVVFGEMTGRVIPESAVKQLLSQGVSEVLSGFGDDGWSGRLVWEQGRVRVSRVDLRREAGVVGSCRACGGDVTWARGSWRCGQCPAVIPGVVSRRELSVSEVQALLRDGRTPRLDGFRQRPTDKHPDGAQFKATVVWGERGVELDYRAPKHTPVVTGPPAAFGEPVACPRCVEAGRAPLGYLIAGKSAWGCSQYRAGCRLVIPFVIDGREMAEEDIKRLLGKQRATKYLKGFASANGKTARVLLNDGGDGPVWRLELRGAAKG